MQFWNANINHSSSPTDTKQEQTNEGNQSQKENKRLHSIDLTPCRVGHHEGLYRGVTVSVFITESSFVNGLRRVPKIFSNVHLPPTKKTGRRAHDNF